MVQDLCWFISVGRALVSLRVFFVFVFFFPRSTSVSILVFICFSCFCWPEIEMNLLVWFS